MISDGAFNILSGNHFEHVQSARRFTKIQLVEDLKNLGCQIIIAKYWVFFLFFLIFFKRQIFEKRRNLMKYLKLFERFIVDNNFDLNKVKLISSLIYLNIAPLHHNPYSQLLFFHGKLELYNYLKNA